MKQQSKVTQFLESNEKLLTIYINCSEKLVLEPGNYKQTELNGKGRCHHNNEKNTDKFTSASGARQGLQTY